jgi:thiopeptide-type bacteriocin biosynthesis protein
VPVLARLPLLPTDGDVDGLLDEGIFLASRHVDVEEASTDRARQTRRAYELRARWRPTPQGVFAGVALADVVDGPGRLCVGDRHRARTHPSAAWLAATLAQLLHQPARDGLLRHLTLTTDATAVRRGQRWEVEAQPTAGRGAVERCTVRATAATDLIMAVCADGADTDAILDAVRARWPTAPESMVLATITDLVSHGFLLTDLISDADGDPLGRMLRSIPPTHPIREPLIRLQAAIAAADAHAPGCPDRLQALARARDLADQICWVDRPLTVDTAADARIVVPRQLVGEAVEAAGVLWRVAARRDPAVTFHRRFVDRYGHHRYVPLLEAADAVIGIGTQTASDADGSDSERVAVLNALIAKSHADGSVEVDLDNTMIAALTGSATLPPLGADVHVRLITDDDHAAAEGRLRVVVTGCAPTGGSTLARFAALLGHRHVEPDTGPAVVAELAVRPRSVSATSVAPTTGFARYRIPIGIAGGREDELRLADLLLVSDGDNLIVWSAVLDRQVIPTLYCRLAPALLPPIAHLLYIIGHSGTTPWHTWSWGTAAAPFHPRVRYRNTILSSARWTLPATLTAAARNNQHWDRELDRWRTRTVPRPPRTVLTEDDDRHLPLDLEHDDDRQLLRRYVRRGLASVTEPPGGPNSTGAVVAGPHGRHLVELVIPMIRRSSPPASRLRAPLLARARGEGLFHPGGPWLSLAIPTEPHLQDEVLQSLAGRADDLVECWDSWFWLRYNTPAIGHHLRARFHGRPDILGGHLLPALASCAAEMSGQWLAGRMTVECYEQEIERYGGPAAIELAEAVFAADSRLVLDLLPGDSDDRITAAAQVAATIARAVADANPAALAGRHLDLTGRQTMNRLRPRVRAADTDDSEPGGSELFAVLSRRLTAYRDALPEHRRADCASSLIHMHANRCLSSGDDEPIMRALAADLLARP